MKLALWRALLAPITSLRALWLWRRGKDHPSYDAAWRQARMFTAPDEMVYRLHGHSPGPADTPRHDPQAPAPPQGNEPPTISG